MTTLFIFNQVSAPRTFGQGIDLKPRTKSAPSASDLAWWASESANHTRNHGCPTTEYYWRDSADARRICYARSIWGH